MSPGKGSVVPVLPFIGAIYAADFPADRLRHILETAFGPLGEPSPPAPFDLSRYYTAEMGSGLQRRFFPFSRLVDPTTLVAIKKECIGLEGKYAKENLRTINLDPGYLDLFKVVLISEKYSGRKIYLGEGMYADLTLLFENGAFKAQQRAFPDFRLPEQLDYFLGLRQRYRTLAPQSS